MKLASMRFCGYSWHHNPKDMSLVCDKKVISLEMPYSSDVLQIFGNKPVVVEIVGQLYGEDCLSQYKELRKVCMGCNDGVLCIPKITPFYASCSGLSVVADDTPDVLTYKARFVQSRPQKNDVMLNTYVSTQGADSLWDIAYKYRVDIARLVELNRELMFINDLSGTKEVKVC